MIMEFISATLDLTVGELKSLTVTIIFMFPVLLA